MFVLLLIISSAIAEMEFPCDFKNRCYSVADSRFDNGRELRQRDANEDFVFEFGTRGISSASYLRSMVSTRDDGYRSTYNGDCEIQLFGVNQVASLTSHPSAEHGGDKIIERFLNGRFTCTRLASTVSPTAHDGTALTGSPTAGGLTLDNCWFGLSLAVQTLGPEEYAILCPGQANRNVMIGGVQHSVNSALQCYGITNTTVEVPLSGTDNMWYCRVMTCSRRATIKKILKVENHLGSNSFTGDDGHLCKEENGCTLLMAPVRETRSPVTADGVHGNFLTRGKLDELLVSKRIQCRTNSTFKLISPLEALALSVSPNASNKTLEREVETVKSEIISLRRADEDLINDVLRIIERIGNMSFTTAKSLVTVPTTANLPMVNVPTIINNQTGTDTEVLAIAIGTTAAIVAALCFIGCGLVYYKRRLDSTAGPN